MCSKKKMIPFLFLYICTIVSGYSQVTIGSGTKPLDGALLQLKELDVTTGEANSSKGLILPRVALVKSDMLLPMFEDDGNNGYVGVTKTTEDALHVGLVVYNQNQCAPFGIGTYVWNGTRWTSIYNLPFTLSPTETLATIPNMLSIPSGRDKRSYASAGFTFDYKTSGANPEWNSLTGTINSGITFGDPGTGIQPGTIASGSWSNTPATFSVLPNMLPTANITANKPWYTKESTINITMPPNACGTTSVSKDIKLNQTNYALAVKAGDNVTLPPYVLYTIRTYPSTQDIYIQGNSSWQLAINTTNNVPLTSIITNTPASSGGSDLSDGTNFSDLMTLTAAQGTFGASGSKGYYATFTFSDPANKALDVEIDVMQCLGSLYKTGSNILVASETDTSMPGNMWGTSVVRHQPNLGFYEEFYSAYFGDAGRWMITNFAGYNYHLIASPPTLSVSATDSFTDAYLVYPQETEGANLTSPTYYNNNPEFGYLYNYTAASAADNTPETQGICPSGWHLPSTDDWLELQAEITTNSTNYALSPTTSAGTAMMNACENFSGTMGLSKPLPEGGFNVFLMGYAANLDGPSGFVDMLEIGETSVFWSSTEGDEDFGHSTYVFSSLSGNVIPLGFTDKGFLSVRCKKN